MTICNCYKKLHELLNLFFSLIKMSPRHLSLGDGTLMTRICSSCSQMLHRTLTFVKGQNFLNKIKRQCPQGVLKIFGMFIFQSTSGRLLKNTETYIWDKVFMSGPSKVCGRQPLQKFENNKFLKGVFHKLYLVHS